MRSATFTWITAMTLFTALAMPVLLAAQEQRRKVRYTVTDLGPVGGTLGEYNSGPRIVPMSGQSHDLAATM